MTTADTNQRPNGGNTHEPPWRTEGTRTDGQGPKRRIPQIPGGAWTWILLVVLLVINLAVSNALLSPEPRIRISYTEFREQLSQDNVVSIVATGEAIQAALKEPITSDDGISSTLVETRRPTFAEDDLFRMLQERDVEVNAEDPDAPPPVWQQLLFGLGPWLLLVWVMVAVYRRSSATLGGLGGLGRSQATRYQPSSKRVTFDDVAGIDEAEEELVEIVDFLRNPSRYTRLGGRIPKGVLLTGPPGTGKTLLARAVAGEAGVPFFSMSASEFVEMIVGVGASRVRDLFRQAKEEAPAIIFIDELDAIGRARGAAVSVGGHDEREQTLNQILTEMDGFTGNEGVIVVAATNRPEILDPALLRPGRFDRHVVVAPPDQKGRAEILAIHTRNVPLADDVDLDHIAAVTPGMVGADLANLVNEAALLAAHRDHDRVTYEDFMDALEKIVLGAARQIMMTPEEKERTAYHESGHALLGMLLPGADPVRKISIIPRGRALGVTLQTPETDRYAHDEETLRARITGMLGGRAAEKIVYGKTSTGAENDLLQATRLARSMAGRWGMSPEIGPMSVIDEQAVDALGRPQASEHALELVDAEARRILDECDDVAVRRLTEHRQRLEALARALLEKETLEETEAYLAAGLEPDRSAGTPQAAMTPPPSTSAPA